MDQQLPDHIKACLHRASEADDHATRAHDPEARAQFMLLAKSWRQLAQSYQSVDGLEDLRQAEKTYSPLPPSPSLQNEPHRGTFSAYGGPLAGPKQQSDISLWISAIVGVSVVVGFTWFVLSISAPH